MSAAKIPPKPEKPAKPAKATVYVDVDDEITAIIDKVEASKHKIVALVLPKRAAALQSIVNMRLLKRNADSAEKNVVLITSEAALLPLAGAAGLHVAKNLQSKPEIPPPPLGAKKLADETPEDLDTEPDEKAKLDYHRSIGELATSDSVEEETIPLGDEDEAKPAEGAAEETPSKNKKLKVPNFDKFRLRIVLAIAGFIGFIIFLVLALVVWPHATITVQTTGTPVSASLNLTTSDSAKALDEAKGIIPAVLKTSDLTSNQQVQATGQQNNGQKATGNVTMTAQKCSGNPFVPPGDVAAGTGISVNGMTYITQANVSFHGTGANGSCFIYASDNGTNITAQVGGAKYNVSGASFSVAGRSDVTANGSAAGGTDNIVTVVAQADLDNAKKKISSQDTDNFSKSFQKQLTDSGLYVLTNTLKAADPVMNATPGIGQPASTITVNIKITYSVLTVQKTDLQKAVGDTLKKNIDSARQKLLNDDVLQGATVTVQNQTSPTAATINVNVQTSAIPILDIPGIKKQVSGQKSGDIRALINNIPGVKGVEVKMNPFWVSKAPKASGKITIILQQVSDQNNGG